MTDSVKQTQLYSEAVFLSKDKPDMNDLIKKLRVMGRNYHSTVTIFEVAADEIERLEEELNVAAKQILYLQYNVPL